MDRSHQVDAFAKQVRDHFACSRYWEYEKKLGSGAFGVAVLLKEKGTLGPLLPRRRMALKLAQQLGERELLNEIRWLKVSLTKFAPFFVATPFSIARVPLVAPHWSY
jgi:hypothetical protein